MNFLPRILAGDQNRKHVSKAAQFFPPLLRLGWLCFVVFFLTFVQAAVSVCMISQVLNPVHCFPREEWRLRMTRQPYKMGEWYARTGWKQPHCSGWKVLVSQASWSDVLPSCGRYGNSNVQKVSCCVFLFRSLFVIPDSSSGMASHKQRWEKYSQSVLKQKYGFFKLKSNGSTPSLM